MAPFAAFKQRAEYKPTEPTVRLALKRDASVSKKEKRKKKRDASKMKRETEQEK